MNAHDQHVHRLLTEIETHAQVSQRSLAQSLGIALGLTNLLLHRIVRKGWVRMVHIKANRVRYLLTPAGLAEKARMSRDSLNYSVRFYAEARDRIRASLARASYFVDRGAGLSNYVKDFDEGVLARRFRSHQALRVAPAAADSPTPHGLVHDVRSMAAFNSNQGHDGHVGRARSVRAGWILTLRPSDTAHVAE